MGEIIVADHENNDWAIITNEGYFDCSEFVKKYIYFVKDNIAYELDQFFDDFYRPGLLAEVLSGEQIERPNINIADKLMESPPPTVEIISPNVGQKFSGKNIEVILKVADNGGGIDEIKLLHNGKRVSENTRGMKANQTSSSISKTYNIVLLKGQNTFIASAFSKGRIESKGHKVTVEFKGIEATSDSYIFVVGIDNYKNSKYNLNYAGADANAIKGVLEKKGNSLFRNIIVYELFSNEATQSNITSTFRKITDNARPQDVFTFFYSGHGVTIPDKKDKEQFYLVPWEVTSMYNEDKIHKSGVSGKQLVNFSQEIDAMKQLFIIDACQSGSIESAFKLKGAAEEKALAQLARSAGIHVVASTQSDQFAAEFGELGHGLFTYVLLEALSGKADGSPKDGKITIGEMNAYLESVVPDYTEKYRGEAQWPVINSNGQDFPIIIK